MKNLIAASGGGDQSITNPALGPSLQGISAGGGGILFFQALIPSLIGLSFVIGSIIFFFMLLIGAIQWISSGGDKAAVESARARVAQALVGVIVLFSAFAIVKVVEEFFGINILAIDIGPLIIK
jgi:hypothetical protein